MIKEKILTLEISKYKIENNNKINIKLFNYNS